MYVFLKETLDSRRIRDVATLSIVSVFCCDTVLNGSGIVEAQSLDFKLDFFVILCADVIV